MIKILDNNCEKVSLINDPNLVEDCWVKIFVLEENVQIYCLHNRYPNCTIVKLN